MNGSRLSVCTTDLRSGRTAPNGYMRTDVLLYGEAHPYADIVADSFNSDASSIPDLLLVMGTSLINEEGGNLTDAITAFSNAVHKNASGRVIFMNRTAPPRNLIPVFDLHLANDIEQWCSYILAQVSFLPLSEPQ